MKNIITTLFVFFIGLTACNKVELPNTQDQTPVFSITGNINNAPIQIVAGNDDYYMHTGKDESNGFNRYFGTLSSGIQNAISLTFMHYTSDTLSDANMINVGSKTFSVASSQTVIGGGNLALNIAASTYGAIQGIESLSTALNGLPFDINAPNYGLATGINAISMEMTTSTGCVANASANCYLDEVTNEIFYGYLQLKDNTNTIEITAKANGGLPPYNYIWGGISFTTTDSVVSVPVTAGNYNVQITDSEGHTVFASVLIGADSSGSLCGGVLSYSFSEGTTTILTPEAYADSWNLVITDPSGTEWRTDRAQQHEDAYFEILEVTNYEHNAAGKPTAKVKARIKGICSNGTGAIWPFEFNEAIFGIELSE